MRDSQIFGYSLSNTFFRILNSSPWQKLHWPFASSSTQPWHIRSNFRLNLQTSVPFDLLPNIARFGYRANVILWWNVVNILKTNTFHVFCQIKSTPVQINDNRTILTLSCIFDHYMVVDIFLVPYQHGFYPEIRHHQKLYKHSRVVFQYNVSCHYL